MGDVAVDDVFESTCFVVSVAYKKYFLRIHNGADAYRKCLGGNLAEVTFEETAVGNDGVGGQCLDACSGCKG